MLIMIMLFIKHNFNYAGRTVCKFIGLGIIQRKNKFYNLFKSDVKKVIFIEIILKKKTMSQKKIYSNQKCLYAISSSTPIADPIETT